MRNVLILLAFGVAASFGAQPAPTGTLPADGGGTGQQQNSRYVVTPGTRIPLSLINTISTKQAIEGDRVYLETAFPILVNGRIVIPPGSYVSGTVTQVKRPGRLKGRGEIYVRFDTLTLPNGVTREFKSRIGGMDGATNTELDRSEGTVKGEGNKAGDARTVGEATAAGTSVGVIAGSAAGHAAMGAGIGAAAGATAGLLGVLLSRGPDAVLSKGTTLEMVLDRPLTFSNSELEFGPGQGRQPAALDGTGQTPNKKSSGVPYPGRRWPGSGWAL